ncbi:MAG: ornithine cyclodeaminase [Hyphomicrobiaceae bacterium]
MLQIDEATVDRVMDWQRLTERMLESHRLPKPEIGDTLLRMGPNSILVRTAWIDGLGVAVKAATIFPGNQHPMATIQGEVLLFDKHHGHLLASIHAASETRWKTAGDSALGSKLLSRPDSRTLLMVGAGTMSEPLIRAHVAVRPSIERIVVWNRSKHRAEGVGARLGDLGRQIAIADDLASAVASADIVSCATMSVDPVVQGGWLKPGAHVDLVGAYRPDMREVDDEAMRRARVFVNFRGTTIGHIGEITIPIETGVIREGDVLADLYDLANGAPGRRSAEEITLYKNGGGAHLDLMTALAITEGARAAGLGGAA